MSGYQTFKFLEWVVSQDLGVGVPVPGCGRIRRHQHKNIPVSLDLEVGVSSCLGVLRVMGVQARKCACVVPRCVAVQVPLCLAVGHLCIQRWGTQVFVSLAVGCPVGLGFCVSRKGVCMFG